MTDLTPLITRLREWAGGYGAHQEGVAEDLTALLDALEGKTAALRDVAAERARQVIVEGWTPEHDDGHGRGELAEAAACYAAGRVIWRQKDHSATRFERLWPWDQKWWKPAGRRRNLVRAGALTIAEIERLDRAKS